MSNELANVATGLSYVIRQSKNRDLIRNSLEKLKELRISAKSPTTRDLIDGFIQEGESKYGFHSYDAAEVLEQPFSHCNGVGTILLYFIGLIAIAVYISAINASLRVGKN